MNCPFKVGQIIPRGDRSSQGIDGTYNRVENQYKVLAVEGPTVRLQSVAQPELIIRVIWFEDGTTGD